MEETRESRRIRLAHGSGGKLMHQLISDLFRKKFHNEILDRLSDSAVIPDFAETGSDLCFTTDSYVVDPLFFPGGDIGKLAVCGTVNDLAVEGAVPLYLTCGMILEEGLELEILERVTDSMAKTAKEAGVKIVAGDLKVVERGKADRIFINTAGVGSREKRGWENRKIAPGDKILVNGPIGEHGVAVMAARGNFELEMDVKSDCAALFPLVREIVKVSGNVKFMRDPTRGGLATTLNELTAGASFGIEIVEEEVPLTEPTRAACEILGFDPFFMANEGKVIIVAAKEDAGKILEAMRVHPLGKDSRIIGEVTEKPAGKVILKTAIGGRRILDMLVGEQLPRIC